MRVPGRDFLLFQNESMNRAFTKKNLWEALPAPAKMTIGRVAGLFPPRLLLGGTYRKWEALVRGAESWDADQIREFQLQRIREICGHARENSRYYAAIFSDAGFDADNIGSLEALRQLPLIDKHTINARADEIVTASPSAGGVDSVSTGGSSGQPLRFLIGADRSGIEFAHLASAWFRVGYTLETPQAVLRGQVIRNERNGLHYYYDPILRRHNYSNFHMDDRSMAQYLDHIRTIGPCYVQTYPSTVNVLVRFLRRSGVTPPANIRGILAGSENVYEADREAAQEIFGARYFSWYGHSEKLVLAAECEHSNDYHVFPTYGFCELVDESGAVVTTPGQRGEIVGTGFINRVMPFIRYRTGDYATYVGDHCTGCGRRHMIVRDIRGHRVQEMLVAGDGSLISWATVNVHDDTFAGVRQFQFEQREQGRVLLRVVPANDGAPPDLGSIRTSLLARFQGRMGIDVQAVDNIELTERGKTVYVKQHLDIEEIMVEGQASETNSAELQDR